MTARFLVGDVFDGLAMLDDSSVDLVVTSPPFLALRSYLPDDHPGKAQEIGTEADPGAFVGKLLQVTGELARVLAPHGSICVELGDTYAGSGGAGGDYLPGGSREGQPPAHQRPRSGQPLGRGGWPLSKCLAMIPESFRWSLAYGHDPFTGQPSPAGQWRIRNVVRWVRPNPAPGSIGDKWRPGTSDLTVATRSANRYWDEWSTRRVDVNGRAGTWPPLFDDTDYQVPAEYQTGATPTEKYDGARRPLSGDRGGAGGFQTHPTGVPLLDWWLIPPGGYDGAHYAVMPRAVVDRCVRAMTPPKVCRTCGEPARRVTVDEWSDCGHDDWRAGVVLDPFAGTGTSLMVATGHGHDGIGIDLDERNADLALARVGPLILDSVVKV